MSVHGYINKKKRKKEIYLISLLKRMALNILRVQKI